MTNNIKDFKKQGITTIKVTEKMKKSSEVGNVINSVENINSKAKSKPDIIKSGTNVSLAEH